MFPIYADVFAQPWFIILMLLIFFGLIVFAVIMLIGKLVNKKK